MTPSSEPMELFTDLRDILFEAGQILLRRQQETFDIAFKEDRSMVTDVDRDVGEWINQCMEKRFPRDAILNEEFCGTDLPEEIANAPRAWMIDPLDSTSNYVKGGHDFAIILGLVQHGVPVVGITFKPALKEFAFAYQGDGAFSLQLHEEGGETWNRLRVDDHSAFDLILSRGRMSSDLAQIVHRLGDPPYRQMHGSLKIVEVAAGRSVAFISPPKNQMSLWDVCGPEVILREAGGKLSDLNGEPIRYRGSSSVLNAGLVACPVGRHAEVLDAIQKKD